MIKITKLLLVSLILFSSQFSHAADYKIDIKGQHAFIQFRIIHLGYSWLYGNFNKFSGDFSFDKNNPEAAKTSVVINMASVDTNHAERDKHLRGDAFFDVKNYPEMKFESTHFSPTEENMGMLYGNLTLHGVTKPVSIKLTHMGEGKDPWGGYRSGFSGTAEINRSDFGITKKLGPGTEKVEIILSIEGIRK
ncbi:MAG: YceI family protein [Gammaproteobacteria bacterium]|jgi:polyisoprenoid-binding protein YceI|nr:YceI family protein [Gammaproteobacteria bacterium]MBT3722454.1 YceI family protein [Gammaproteobacteria bacterium]MBT4077819.1 YceI family protein [Gammaproteobacteria bacterium]MBT4196533.1 YceI family protein [Gammaproteobacteria bacterium]MBT4450219.1 YceI family protein [Gammaproteobacteria bacterium]